LGYSFDVKRTDALTSYRPEAMLTSTFALGTQFVGGFDGMMKTARDPKVQL